MQKPKPIGTQAAGASPPPAPPPRAAASATPPIEPPKTPVMPPRAEPPPNDPNRRFRPDLTDEQFSSVNKYIEGLPPNVGYKVLERFLAGAKIQAQPWEQNISHSLLGQYRRTGDGAFAAEQGYIPKPTFETPQMKFGSQVHGLIDAYLGGKFDPERPELLDPALKGFMTDPRFAEHKKQFDNFRNFHRYFDVLGHETRYNIRGGKAEELGLKPEYDPSGQEMPVNMAGVTDLLVRFKPEAGPQYGGKIYSIDTKTTHFTPEDRKDLLAKSVIHKAQHTMYRFLDKHASTPPELAALEKMKGKNYHVEGYGIFYPSVGSFIDYDTADLDKVFDIQTKKDIQSVYKILAGMPRIPGLPPQHEEAKKAARAKGFRW